MIETGPSEADVRAVLATVPDPEIPVLSVVDLGIIHRVDVGRERLSSASLTNLGNPNGWVKPVQLAPSWNGLNQPFGLPKFELAQREHLLQMVVELCGQSRALPLFGEIQLCG